MRTRLVAAILALLAAIALGACAGGDDGNKNETADKTLPASPSPYEVTVLTRNLYLGADLAPLFAASAEDLGTAVRATYDQMIASDVEARLDAVAREIVDNRPDLVALQEASIWRLQKPGATDTELLYDFVQILLDRLEQRGSTYTVAATVDGFNGGLPVADVGLVTMQDRDVILVREGSSVKVAKPTNGTFTSRLQLSIVGIPIEVVRGWAAVDATIGDRTFRIVGTHLEAFDDAVRDKQQQELVQVIDQSTVPTLVLGDLNSAAGGDDSKAYEATLAAGMTDAWSAAPTAGASTTCCRTPDLTGGSLSERIDFVLFRDPFDTIAAEIVGADTVSLTDGGLRASDHAGVLAVLEVGTR